MTDDQRTPEERKADLERAQQESGITREQYDVLMRPLNKIRVSTRKQGGKDLSYVEAWDIKAHLTRVFGFGNWDFVVTKTNFLYQRDVQIGKENPKPGWEVAFEVVGTLRVRDQWGNHLCEHAEGAVGYFSGAADLGGLYDNALKAGASDALKRCAIALGTGFGLSLYAGTTNEVVKGTVVTPPGWVKQVAQTTEEQEKMLNDKLGATPIEENVESGDAEVTSQGAAAGDAGLSTDGVDAGAAR